MTEKRLAMLMPRLAGRLVQPGESRRLVARRRAIS